MISLHKQALLKDVLGGNCEYNSNFHQVEERIMTKKKKLTNNVNKLQRRDRVSSEFSPKKEQKRTSQTKGYTGKYEIPTMLVLFSNLSPRWIRWGKRK